MKRYKFSLEGKTFEVITYNLDELPEASKNKAIQDHLNFLNETEYDYLDNSSDDDIKEVIDNIDANEYEYDFNGELVAITTYLKNNKPTGKKSIRINKQEIDLIEVV